MTVSSAAPAKLNLYLHVGAPRADGYHPLDSLVMFAREACDVVTVAPADGLSLHLSGPFAATLSEENDNLVLRAARALAAHGGVRAGAAIDLDKRLPIASGIGGGSSDAAAALRTLNVLWRLHASDADLESVAVALGADVPVCVRAQTAHMGGIGERLTPMQAPQIAAVLVNPGAASPTGAVYRAFDAMARFGALGGPPDLPRSADAFIDWVSCRRNDLEAPACAQTPEIAAALAVLREIAPTALVRMSGSGATCFALTALREDSIRIADALAAARPDWWVCASSLGNDACPVQEAPA